MSATATASVPEPVVRDDKMPSGIPFIISNEFAERFCFYGINSILATYLANDMHFTDAKAASWQSLFKMSAYFFPMVGAIISDVFWGKFKTIMVFSLVYAAGCVAVALLGSTPSALAISLLFVALGTGGIKPCVSTNVGDQFTAKNQHLIERAFSLFYFAINAGSSISIWFCPILLADPAWGPKWAFGMPAAMMMIATVAFWAGRNRYAHVPPAGKAWLKEVCSKEGVSLILRLLVIYFFVTIFWMLWDQGNGNTWTLQAQSKLMDKNLGFGITLLPAQIQVVNGLFILILAPIFSFFLYPFLGKFFKVTPLRKIGMGLFTTASSFLVVAWIEQRIQDGHVVSLWWQILAYVILTAGEVLVSITALEFSYKQAPLKLKSFVMGLFLLSTAAGNLLIAAVNEAMIKPLHATAIEAGAETWVTLDEAREFIVGQKIDFTGKTGIEIEVRGEAAASDAKPAEPAAKKMRSLEGTFLVSAIDQEKSRVRLLDPIEREPVRSSGTFAPDPDTKIGTYLLVGPVYFYFFVGAMCVAGLIYIVCAYYYKEQTHVRT
jgi:POT family proton-dependent oligopeptide transporter